MNKNYFEHVDVKGRDIEGREITVRQSRPSQLPLFQMLMPDDIEGERAFSNSIELYDALPKYYNSNKKMADKRHGGKFLDSLERQFEHRQDKYKLEISPARIKRKNAEEVEYYPTPREMLVEEALRKMALNPDHGVYLDGRLGVRFTLYQLQKELKLRGHSIKYSALVESLTICNKTNISLTKLSGSAKPFFNSTMFPTLLMSDREAWLENPKSAYCYVQFNELVTKSLKEISYRMYDYLTFFKYKKPLSQWLHKRIYHNFRQASKNSRFQILEFHLLTSTIVRDSGLIDIDNGAFRKQILEVEAALDELKREGVILSYGTERRMDGKKIIEAKHTIKVSFDTAENIVLANKRRDSLVNEAGKIGKLKIEYDREKAEQIMEIVD